MKSISSGLHDFRKHCFLVALLLSIVAVPAASQTYSGPQEDIDAILSNVKSFSAAYMSGDYDAMAMAYTEDGKIMPNNTRIISGREDIRARWVLPDSMSIKLHEIHPEEIKVLGEHAYDYGYYNGITVNPDGSESAWKGKYVIVWQKVDGEWKMYLDIWNSVAG